MKFLDLYKSFDNIIKDSFNSDTGVTEYINRMEDKMETGSEKVSGWKDDYYLLKHLRWLRNQITHESGQSECDQQDLQDLREFRERLLSCKDPLAQFNRKLKAEKSAHKSSHPSYGSAQSSSDDGVVLLIAIVMGLLLLIGILILTLR